MVINQDIVSGLRAALERGQSLRSAMISFFNAGYPREEIEDAARALIEFGTNPNAEPTQVTPSVSNQIQPVRTQPAQPKPQKPQPQVAPKVPQAIQQPMQNIPSRQAQPSPLQKMKEEAKAKPAQKISGYGTPRKRKSSLTIIILILLLVVFVGLLISIFLFKQQLIDWLSTMF